MLVAVAILFLLLISPSEVLHFYEMLSTSPAKSAAFEVALVRKRNSV